MTHDPQWMRGVHHDGSARYVSNPTPKFGETISIRLRTPQPSPLAHIYLRAMIDGEFEHFAMQPIAADHDNSALWECDFTVTQPRTSYCFRMIAEDARYYYTTQGVSIADSPDLYNFTLVGDYDAPAWVTDAIFYQIFPDRFRNGDPTNDVKAGEYELRGQATITHRWDDDPLPWKEGRNADFFGGDIQGITQSLDYLQELGVSALYLCPIFSALSNHKYDILDFWNVDVHFGGNDALIELRQELTKRGMQLILDITPNHISFRHPWFLAAQDDPHAPSADYFFKNGDDYETWLGVPSLIKLNYNSPQLRERMYRADDSAMRHWLKPPYSIDGWRLDVANMTANFQMSQIDHDVWREVRQSLKAEKADAYLMGEYFQDPTPHLQGDELDAAMNYQGFNTPMRRWIGGADLYLPDSERIPAAPPMPTEALAQQWRRFMGAVPYPLVLQQFNQLGSHDTSRISFVAGYDAELVKLATALLVAFPGVPCLYYGDEVGLRGGEEPYNRRTFSWNEDAWDTDLLAYHQQLLSTRHSSEALKRGSFQILYAAGDTIAFLREAPDEQIVVIGHRGAAGASVTIDVAQGGIADGRTLVDLLGEARYTVTDGSITLMDLAHGQALFLTVQ